MFCMFNYNAYVRTRGITSASGMNLNCIALQNGAMPGLLRRARGASLRAFRIWQKYLARVSGRFPGIFPNAKRLRGAGARSRSPLSPVRGLLNQYICVHARLKIRMVA